MSTGVTGRCKGEQLGGVHINSLSQHLIHSDHITTATTVVQGRQVENSESLLIRTTSDAGNQSRGSSLYSLDTPLVFTVKWSPNSVGILQMRANHCPKQQR